MRVLLVDDDSLICESLKILLELQGDLEVAGTCKNGQEALALLEKEDVDVVLMDIRMPVMDGVQATKTMKEAHPDRKIILLTTFKEDEYIKEAIGYGAEGYILKSQSSDSIIESIRSVFKGNTVYQKEVMTSLTDLMKKPPEPLPMEEDLTPREMEILKGVGEGKSNREISQALFLGEGTVRNYITKLLDKLELRDRTQLAIYYLKHGKEE
ncbi:response regulator transcription factor [Isachenkonia alkalipeptolytica]|uniref:Stage 0 sporulation protein A homolog n=1 Tax=Isachenkonia alkalipeptolytica TaxID=2565777 RepID=A0AA44BCF5_9CLOT|nr:response regulator transcription factor [Isachenkonia alkalipeptolytica]